MISKKILYSEQLLQLVLALSLLQVDPVNYLNLEFGFSRIHSNDGSPWQLEVSHRPFSIYPYMGRKHYTPLYDDLSVGYNDVQAYLLNLSDEPAALFGSNTFNTTENDSVTIELSQGGGGGGEGNSNNTLNLNLIQDFPSSNIDEIFFHNDEQLDTVSISEQNLADLNDYDAHHKQIKNYSLDPWEDLRSSPTRSFDRRGAGSSLNSDASNWEALSWINISSFSNDEPNEENNVQQDLEKETKEKADSTKIKSDDVDELSNISSVELTLEVSRACKTYKRQLFKIIIKIFCLNFKFNYLKIILRKNIYMQLYICVFNLNCFA